MRKQIEILAKLQQIDNEKKEVQSKLEHVAIKIEAWDRHVSESETMLEDESTRLEDFRKQYRQFEADIQMNLDQIKKSNEKLRSVKTNKEYQSMLKEIEEIKKKNSAVEDEMLVCLDQMEAIEKDLQSKTDEYRKMREQVAAEKESFLKSSEQNEERLSELDLEWNKVSQTVDSEVMQKYNMVKQKVRNNALAAVRDAVCQGCYLNIPPQLYNELQRFESLTFCPHCQRIIYWQEP